MEAREKSSPNGHGPSPAAGPVTDGLLVAAAILRASGLSVNAACAEANTLFYTLKHGWWLPSQEVERDVAF